MWIWGTRRSNSREKDIHLTHWLEPFKCVTRTATIFYKCHQHLLSPSQLIQISLYFAHYHFLSSLPLFLSLHSLNTYIQTIAYLIHTRNKQPIMSAFSVNSMLNQVSDTDKPSRPPRPSVLDISNLLCGEDLEPTLSPSSSNGSNSAIQSPISASSSCCQLPSIMDVWPAQQLPMLPPMPSQKPLHPLEPASSAAATANSIWMHHSMASSVSSVASDMSNSTSATANASTTSLPNMVPESSTSTRTLPLKKQARRHYHKDITLHSNSSSSGSSDDDQEEPVSSLIPSSPSLPPVKAKRRRANAKQLQVLNRVFERTVFPSTQLRAELGRQLGMTPRTVQIWFQNRRQAIRTRERQRLLRIVSDDSSSASLSTAMD